MKLPPAKTLNSQAATLATRREAEKAAALRENLRRRKAQLHAQAAKLTAEGDKKCP